VRVVLKRGDRRFGRRALESISLTTVNLILAAIVILLFIGAVWGLHHDDRSVVSFYANDLSLLVSSLQAVPGSVLLYYSLPEGYVVSFRKGLVKVQSQVSGFSAEASFHLLPGLKFSSASSSGLVPLRKEGDTLILGAVSSSSSSSSSTVLSCPSFLPSLESPLFSVGVQKGFVSPSAFLNDSLLRLLVNHFSSALRDKNIFSSVGSVPIISFVFSSEDPLPDEEVMVLRRSLQSGDLEVNAQILFCWLNKYAIDNDLSLVEEYDPSLPPYRYELVFHLHKDAALSLLSTRHYFLEDLVDAFASLRTSSQGGAP